MSVGVSAPAVQMYGKVSVEVRVACGEPRRNDFPQGTTVGEVYNLLAINKRWMGVVDGDYTHPVGCRSVYRIPAGTSLHFSPPFRISLLDPDGDPIERVELPIVGLGVPEVLDLVRELFPNRNLQDEVDLNSEVVSRQGLANRKLKQQDQLGLIAFPS